MVTVQRFSWTLHTVTVKGLLFSCGLGFFSTGVLEHQLTVTSGIQWVKGICQERCHGTANTANGSYGMSYSW